MTLPPEILGTILEHIPIDKQGQQTLIACALVATWWTGPSQRRLFSSVTIDNVTYQRWMDGIATPGSKSHLLEYVRSLQHHLAQVTNTGHWMRHLHNVHSLSLFGIRIGRASVEEFRNCFSVFRETLTNLTLEHFVTSFSAFVTLVDYFPNLTGLRLGLFEVKPGEGLVPPLSRPLRGRIYLRCADNRCAEFFDRLAKLDPQYEELILESGHRVEWELVESLLQLCASTVKYLRLITKIQREYSYEYIRRTL